MPTPYYDNNGRRVDPKKIPAYLRRNRQFISRGIRNRPIDINDLPSVPAVAPNTVPRKDYWEDCLVGAGATVAQLDTIRRTMATVFLAPNADVCEVTKNMLTKLQTPNLGDPLGIYGKPNSMTNIPGVAKANISNTSVIRSNAIAQRKTQQARRGALNNRE